MNSGSDKGRQNDSERAGQKQIVGARDWFQARGSWPLIQLGVRWGSRQFSGPGLPGSCLLSGGLGGVSIVAPAAEPTLQVDHLQGGGGAGGITHVGLSAQAMHALLSRDLRP